jgi:hypothetical protein
MGKFFDRVYKDVVLFLNKYRYQYLIIGGIAAGVLGEPRATGDIDVDILLGKGEVALFLTRARSAGFKFSKKKCLEQIKKRGVFQIKSGDFHIDFIVTSIRLEEEALRRKKIIRLYGVKAFFPTAEDFILLKVIPGRPQDLIDAQKAVIRHKGKLDIKYLLSSARDLSEEAEDMRIYNTVKQLVIAG